MDETEHTPAEPLHFEPPLDYPLEPVLHEPIPRPVPDFVYQSEAYRKQQWSERGMLLVAGLCLLAQFTPAVQAFSLYILPLAYIGWLGAVLVLVYFAMVAFRLRGDGQVRYLTHGIPVVGQVTDLVKKPTVVINSSEVSFAYEATVTMVHPYSGAVVSETITSEDLPASQKGRYRTSLRVGDLVTVLHLPERADGPFQLYGFLGHDPDARLIYRDPEVSGISDTLAAALVVSSIAALILSLVSIERYEPLAFPVTPWTILVVSGTMFLGLFVVGALFLRYRKARRHRAERNALAVESGDAVEIDYEMTGFFAWPRRILYGVAIVAGVLLLCGAVSTAGLFFVNGFFDGANPAPVPVRIEERYSETHAMVFRQYKVKYIMEGETKVRTRTVSPEALERLLYVEATALVKPGFLGWPWVAAIVPVPVNRPEGGMVAEKGGNHDQRTLRGAS